LDLAARQGLSLYTQNNSAGTLNVTPFAVDAEKKTDSPVKKKIQKGDFIYKYGLFICGMAKLLTPGTPRTEDMLAILFPVSSYPYSCAPQFSPPVSLPAYVFL